MTENARRAAPPRLFPLAAGLALVMGCGRVEPVADDADGSPVTFVDGDAGAEDSPACVAGEAVPPEMVGAFFVVEDGCRESAHVDYDAEWTRMGLFFIEPCGAAFTWVPDGAESSGHVRRQGEGYVYESQKGFYDSTSPLVFTVAVSSEQRAGKPVLELQSSSSPEPWRAWAVRRQDYPGKSAAPPKLEVCAVHESWTSHAFTGAGPGVMLGAGEGAIAPGDDLPRLWVGQQFEGTLRMEDPRLNFPFEDRGYYGQVVAWSGKAGEGHAEGPNACVEVDGVVQLAWDGHAVTTEVDWLLVDVDDLDADGDPTNLIVRRTRTEWRPGACPSDSNGY